MKPHRPTGQRAGQGHRRDDDDGRGPRWQDREQHDSAGPPTRRAGTDLRPRCSTRALRNASAQASPVRISGVALTSVSDHRADAPERHLRDVQERPGPDPRRRTTG